MKKTIFTILFTSTILFLLSPLSAQLRCMGIMFFYNHEMKQQAFRDEENFSVYIPSDNNWFPFVLTYKDTGFSDTEGYTDVSLTILYNFPSFSLKYGCSNLFNPKSDYYNSFYGAYLTQCKTEKPFGILEDGTIIEDELVSIPRYDFYYLVLSDFGLDINDYIFDCEITEIEDNIPYAGMENFTRIDADILVNGAFHKPSHFSLSYHQYGKPNDKKICPHTTQEPFAPVQMYGRIYAKYLKGENKSIFFYIIAKKKEILEQCDETLLSKSRCSPLH